MIMFIWTGRGFWAFLFPILFLGGLGLAVSLTFGEPALDRNPWIYGVALFASAAAVWTYGRRWNGTKGLKPWDFRAAVRYRRPHRMFAVPMEFWAAPLALFGLWTLAEGLMTGLHPGGPYA